MSTVDAVATVTASTPLRAGTAPRRPLRRAFAMCAVALAGQAAVMLAVGQSWETALLPGYGILTAAFAAVFCLGAVTVAGFAAGAAAAGLVLLGVSGLLPVLAGAALVAVGCGVAPGWARVEAWQAARSRPLTGGQEAGVARSGRRDRNAARRSPAAWLRATWRTDRVLAAWLVLAFPGTVAHLSMVFLAWTAGR